MHLCLETPLRPAGRFYTFSFSKISLVTASIGFKPSTLLGVCLDR
jgi:hypothetical protein